MQDQIAVLSEPLLGLEFNQYRLVGPLAEKLSDRFDISVVAPAIATDVAERLREHGVEPVSGGAHFPRPRTPRDEVPSFVMSWARDAFLTKNARRTEELLRGRSALRVNMSMSNSAPSDLWYVQSRPIGESIDSVIPNLSSRMRAVSHLASPVVRLLDRRHFANTIGHTQQLYTNSGYLVNWYRAHGYTVAGTVPVYLYPTSFAPTTRSPTRDYALCYLGKETDMATLNTLISTGIPVKLFGGKSAEWVRQQLGHHLPSTVTMFGRVSHQRLMELYSNALFTAFPFTEEPFGLVPIESMACATPVLTYSSQGPGETVVNGLTGWLVPNASEFVDTAIRIFHRGYSSVMVHAALSHSEQFRLDSIATIWQEIFRAGLEGREGPTMAPAAAARSALSATSIGYDFDTGRSPPSWVTPPARFLQR